MLNAKAIALLAAAALLGAPTIPSQSHVLETVGQITAPAWGGSLSVMTYNIKGLPWPVASGRAEAVAEIGHRLATMRSSSNQPHIVLLQEAFGDKGREVGERAGYPFIVTGPQSSPTSDHPPLGREFADEAQWIKGEKSGSVIDSGLAILSDNPIRKIERYAFPRGACAGYDCLAAKGVLVAWIDVPGADEPVAVVNTHLNSRRATHVSNTRADRAYAWQVAAVRGFLLKVLPSRTPVIFAGDFNTGSIPAREAAVSDPLINGKQSDGLRVAVQEGSIVPGSRAEARAIVDRNKDKVLFRNGANVVLKPQQAWVPFALSKAEPLSDHAGFVVDYAIQRNALIKY